MIITSTISRTVITRVAILLVSGLVVSSNMALAASDDAATAPSTAASSAERVMSDSWITTKVKSEILANSVSKAFKVSVKTKAGAVTLTGKLPSQDAIDLVKMISEKVKGVKSVDVSGLAIGTS
jgi:hyperosmotically inducible protein